jgi:hypothetical protein
MLKGKPFITTGALFMGLIVVLGAIGIVNGLWSKNLVINGVVETGDLNADWDCGYTNDDGSTTQVGPDCALLAPETSDDGLDPIDFNWPNFVRSDPFVLKDVGECTLTIGDINGDDPTTTPPGYGNQVAYVTLTNAYPSYECTVTLALSNTGSIPFNLVSADLILAPESEGIIETTAVGVDGPVDVCDPNPLEGTQVDPGTELLFTCTVHVTQIAAQSTCTGATTTTASGGPTVEGEDCGDPGTTYRFAVDVCVAQWNEEPTAEECKSPLVGTHEGPPTTTFPAP